jgi:hypothetical protein
MQLGFDMDFADPVTGGAVPWAVPTPALLQAISRAAWKVVDVETTELNFASVPLDCSGKDLRRGINNKPRLRIVSVLYPTRKGVETVSFDLDQHGPAKGLAICAAVLSGVFFAHNAGFDAFWTRLLSKTMPKKVLDSMLIARVLIPQQPLLLAQMANDENEDADFRTEAIGAFEGKRSGWSLADLCMTQLRKILDKDMQGPRNWMEPFLTQKAYDYATGDVINTYALLFKLFGMSEGDDLLEAYEAIAAKTPSLRLVEPQVLDVVLMRETGMPWSADGALAYVASQAIVVAGFAEAMLQLEPTFSPFMGILKDPNGGVTADLKNALGEAFRRRGLILETTEKTAQPKIGEKDLRKANATNVKEAKPLFDAWTKLARAKKAASMAHDFTGFSKRSGTGRIHSNIGHGPVTGRLSSSEPNVQQAPKDQGFRNAVAAGPGEKVAAVDYGALDMRVAAALAIRAQRQIHQVFEGNHKVQPDVLLAVRRVYKGEYALAQTVRIEADAEKLFSEWKLQREELTREQDGRKSYWDKWRKLARTYLVARFQRCLAYVRERARAAGTPEWGSLRDAFDIPGMDIHTWTALSMNGEDPKVLFGGKSNEEVAKGLEQAKARLGDKRKAGKVSNLSLTYAMKELGFQDSAAKIHDIHWTIEESTVVRSQWLATYVEIDLWHAWTELNPSVTEFTKDGFVFVPDPEKGMRFVKKPVFAAITLGGRLIYALGLNAGLAYEDQSTGADILGTVMDTLRQKYPKIFFSMVNQVHDECVFVFSVQDVEEYTKIAAHVMVSSAELFLEPYGVKAEVSPTIGAVWIKD